MALQKHAEIEISTEKNEQFKNKIQLNLAKTATKIITNKRQDADELKTAREVCMLKFICSIENSIMPN